MRKGFTLIELLVVVLIIGILASVALPQYFKSVEKSRSAEAINVLSSFADAHERYYMKTGTFRLGGVNNCLKEFDVDISNLAYFTVSSAGATGSIYYASATRIDSAGGGLGRYAISLYYSPTGLGKRSWKCSPSCNSFLPKGFEIVQQPK